MSLTIVEAVILILKHATTLRLSNTVKEALTQAEVDYKEANIDLKIQEYVKSFTAEDYVGEFAGFIMATKIGLFIYLSITTMSHLSFKPKQVHREGH